MSEGTETHRHTAAQHVPGHVSKSAGLAYEFSSWFLKGKGRVCAGPAHHDPVGLLHVLQEVAGVGGDRTDPHTPHEREEPALINHPQVHRHVVSPQFPVRY